ncbi:hypothetical protein GCM10025868_09880 [Angustibacter aerolatus]|uniref:Amidase domain-containing protein n=1 Tax=Angustibacter aerolatus TaxID=1162965 RepID=A0ABQ6JC47_9ACTN|nr:hypothetical protein GCM10025868_09880 [Angustibacter aerolatus]
MLGALDRSAMQARADERLRSLVLDAVADVLQGVDVLVTPTLAVLPVANRDDGTTTGPSEVGGVPVDPSIGWCLTYPFNFTGHPAASVPAGLADGLPVGLQVVGQRHDDAGVLAVGAALEAVLPWATTYPGAGA